MTRPGEPEEQCNGIDDDCNGVTDDIIPGALRDSDIGACEFGRLRCAAGQLLCEGEVQAVGEVVMASTTTAMGQRMRPRSGPVRRKQRAGSRSLGQSRPRCRSPSM